MLQVDYWITVMDDYKVSYESSVTKPIFNGDYPGICRDLTYLGTSKKTIHLKQGNCLIILGIVRWAHSVQGVISNLP